MKRSQSPSIEVVRSEIAELTDLPNIAEAVAKDLRRIGISSPKALIGRDAYQMYEELCRVTGKRHDPCMLDTFIAVVRFMGGEAAKPWWKYTAERKRRLAGEAVAKARGG